MPDVLLVEDDPIQAEVAALVCHALGYRVTIAPDAATALAAADRQAFGLALVDFRLPDMAGDTLIRLLRERAAARPYPILGVTGWDVPQDLRAMRESGATLIVRKPFLARTLREAIQAV